MFFQLRNLTVSPPTPYYINFELFIGRKKDSELDLPEGLFAKPAPTPEDLAKGVRSKSFDFALDNTIAISIRVSKIRRSIQNDMGFIWWPD